MGWFNEMQRLSASPENAVKLQRALVADRRPRPAAEGEGADPRSSIRADDQVVPFARGRGSRAAHPGRGVRRRWRARTISCSRRSRPGAMFVADGAANSCAATQAAGGRGDLAQPSRRTRSGHCTAPDGAKIAYADQRRGLSAGQGAELDDTPRARLDQPGLPATGSRKLTRSNRLIRSDMRGFRPVGAGPPRFDFRIDRSATLAR